MASFSISRMSFLKLLELGGTIVGLLRLLIVGVFYHLYYLPLKMVPARGPKHMGIKPKDHCLIALLTAACLGLHHETFGSKNVDHLFVCTGTFVGYLIILIGVFGGYIMQAPISKRVDIFYSLAGCALFIASGVMSIQYYENWDSKEGNMGLAKGSLAIINGGAFLVDAILSFRNE